MKTIRHAVDMEQLVQELGFLPFFRCGLPGLSVQERIAPGNWFPDEGEGPWEWKGPIIREGHCAYGKIFRRQAGFVSLEWLPHLLNVRRAHRYAKDEDTAALDEMVLQTILSAGSATVKELRSELNSVLRPRGARRKDENGVSDSRVSLDPILTRLMMGLHIVIADFEYNIDRHGRRYGWGVARYTTPEALYGRLHVDATPDESRQLILNHLRRLFPDVPDEAFLYLIVE